MGFSTILDILGSVIISGMLMVILMRLQDANTENIFNNGAELSLQQNLAVSAMVLEHDFRRIGYCKKYNLMPSTNAIIAATDSSISFLTDVNDVGKIDTLHYYLGPASELTSTSNPRDRFLYRVVNNEQPQGINLGITQFRLVYFTQLGDTLPPPINQPTLIAAMEINIAVENVEGYDQQYSSAFWRQIRLAAKNLKNR
jgi:type II secretory pathway component PulJ